MSEPDDRRKTSPGIAPGGGGGVWIGERAAAKTYNKAEWVNQKQAEGDLTGGFAATHSGTSIFDPVLTELSYRWFCPPGGLILDPFAGGSVRGIVAAKLGRRYVGIDLSARQIAANRDQAARLLGPDDPAPEWIEGDSLDIARLAGHFAPVDFLFSCPPYGDLEVYSTDPRDLSYKPFSEFMDCYREIIKAGVALLKPDAFACFVVGDFRDKAGFYRGFPWRTVDAFEQAGMRLYNEAVLVTATGSLALRTRKQFESSRKLGKTHQNILTFAQGDPKKATVAIGPVQFYKGDDADAEEPEPAVAAPLGWKVSAKWLGRQHDCTLNGILKRCNGGCCKGDSYWPSRTFAEEGKPTICGNLGPQGCVLAPDDKPVTCLLYPAMLNDNGTLILHHRTTAQGSVCRGNHGQGPRIIEALEENLSTLFGADEYARVRADVIAGRDSYFYPSKEILAAYHDERRREELNQRPVPRSQLGPARTPIEQHGDIWLKRDDLFEMAGMRGGKVRTCWHLAQGESAGLVTAGSRASPQINIVAHIAAHMGIGCRAHTPSGELGPEVAAAQAVGAEIFQHGAGYNNVIVARAREDAKATGWREIPFGMECQEAVDMTATQIGAIPAGVKRIVVPVGSGMSLAGILAGLAEQQIAIPVLGVVVGADPVKRLDKYAPPHWRDMATLVSAGMDYHKSVEATVGGVVLDPIYEAKCARFLQPGDMLWIVGVRQEKAAPNVERPAAEALAD